MKQETVKRTRRSVESSKEVADAATVADAVETEFVECVVAVAAALKQMKRWNSGGPNMRQPRKHGQPRWPTCLAP